METALLDTSIIVALHQEDLEYQLPETALISAITLAELYTGVLIADSEQLRGIRLDTLVKTEQTFVPLPVDADVARRYGDLIAQAKSKSIKTKPFDALIAATALSHRLPVITRDRDFLQFKGIADLEIAVV